MEELESTTYCLSNDVRNISVVEFAVENVPEVKCFGHPPQALAFGSRRCSRSLLPRAKEELRSAGGAKGFTLHFHHLGARYQQYVLTRCPYYCVYLDFKISLCRL
jgi:hypothetical protein